MWAAAAAATWLCVYCPTVEPLARASGILWPRGGTVQLAVVAVSCLCRTASGVVAYCLLGGLAVVLFGWVA